MAIIDFLRKKFNVPDGKTLTEIQEPFDCWHDVIKLMDEHIRYHAHEHNSSIITGNLGIPVTCNVGNIIIEYNEDENRLYVNPKN